MFVINIFYLFNLNLFNLIILIFQEYMNIMDENLSFKTM